MTRSSVAFTDPTDASASVLAAAIAARHVSASEAVLAYLERINRLNASLNAVVHLDAERALRTAAEVDSSRRKRLGPLHGVPVLLKDSHVVRGMPTIVGNAGASTAPSRRDGIVAERLRSAGAILIGKTNVPTDLADFQTANEVHGRTNNPWDLSRTPGGSSGGAAAAVAARLTPLEIGSDIAGSIRVPAHFTGVIGLKPTRGITPTVGHVVEPTRHPRGGGLACLAVLGPMARDFDDLALGLGVISCQDRRKHPPCAFELGRRPVRIAVMPTFPGVSVERAISEAIERMASTAESDGWVVTWPRLTVDLRRLHAMWVGVFRAAQAYGKAWIRLRSTVNALRQYTRGWDEAIGDADALLCPPAMCRAFTHRQTGEPIEVDGAPVPYWGISRYTEPFSLTGHPALVLPLPSPPGWLPSGVQVVGRHSHDRCLINVGRALSTLADPIGQATGIAMGEPSSRDVGHTAPAFTISKETK